MSKLFFPTLCGKKEDIVFILLPPFLVLAIIAALPSSMIESTELSPWVWLLLVVGIDVSHVYSTLYRTYFKSAAIEKYGRVLYFLPVIGFVGAVLIYSFGARWFWTSLAYLAVFHFVRQQYGFMKRYARFDSSSSLVQRLESVIIYAGTLYPIVFWHLTPDRKFNWFIEEDFYSWSGTAEIKLFFLVLYLLIIALWIILMIREYLFGAFNLPKHLIIAGTYLSWYFGIVYYNSDLAFTALNVVSHGIPYMALIYFSEKKSNTDANENLLLKWKHWGWVIFLASLLGFAFIEEALWDGLHWRDHRAIFSWIYFLPAIRTTEWQSFVVPLLALPQITHYLIDGVIWRKGK
jgi:hypothetical protein